MPGTCTVHCGFVLIIINELVDEYIFYTWIVPKALSHQGINYHNIPFSLNICEKKTIMIIIVINVIAIIIIIIMVILIITITSITKIIVIVKHAL